MKRSSAFRRLAIALTLLSPTLVFAHPGHDGDHGGGLTWDFAGNVLHVLGSPYHLLPLLAAASGVLGLFFWLRGRTRGTTSQTTPSGRDRRA